MKNFLMIVTLACGGALIAGPTARKVTACDNPGCINASADVSFCDEPGCQ